MEMRNIFLKIVPLKMPLATFVKRLASVTLAKTAGLLQTGRESILRLISILFVMKPSVCYRMIWLNRVTLRGELKYSLSRNRQENVVWSSIKAELLTASLNSTPTRYLHRWIGNELAQYRVFTTVDLKSVYHQLELNPRDREFTAFQSGNALYQWQRLRFGLTNAVPEFQRTIDYIVRENDL